MQVSPINIGNRVDYPQTAKCSCRRMITEDDSNIKDLIASLQYMNLSQAMPAGAETFDVAPKAVYHIQRFAAAADDIII